MRLLKDILATAVGVGPNYKTDHQKIRDLFRIGGGEYTKTAHNMLEINYTLPFVNYGSTIEDDSKIYYVGGKSFTGGSLADEWYNTLFPDSKKPRLNREGSKSYNPSEVASNSRFLPIRSDNGPQTLYNYYENGGRPGPRLAVLIVDEMGTDQNYGTKMSNVKFGFKAKLTDWNEAEAEYQGIELTHLYIDGKYQAMSPKATEAAMLYAKKLTAMIFKDTDQDYDPAKAMQDVLTTHGQDVFKESTWAARRNAAPKAATPV